MISGLVIVLLLTGLPATASGQWYSSGAPAEPSDSFWKRFALGAGVSLLAHESAHILTSLALGFHPYIAFDKGRPTVFSGIASNKYPRHQPDGADVIDLQAQLSLIFGGLSAIHALRISRDSSYAHFLVRPTQNGAALGVSF